MVLWSGELDRDVFGDWMATIEGSCSGWGECEVLVYLGCSGSSHRRVYGPEYAVQVDVGARQRDGVRQLIKVERWGDAARPEVRYVPLNYVGDRYVEGTGSRTRP
ncbi:MAG TPA: hypothetical protein VLC09_11820 [Polyangiaceae bacterium]|nr:hypothetical protein [Polyangiaceae bacterium]